MISICRGTATFVVALALTLVCGPVRAAAFAAPSPASTSTALPAEPSAGCSGTTQPVVRGERREITVGGETRSYLIDAPASEPGTPRPVVLAFHGFRSDAGELRAGSGLVTVAEHEGVILVMPEGHEGVHLLGAVGRGWDLGGHATRDVAVVRALLDALERERCVDRRRIFATGMSNGGFFASLAGCRLADRVAAVAPVAGGMALPDCTVARPVAVLLTYGRADDIIPPSLLRGARDWWAKTDGCGAAEERDGCTQFQRCAADVIACEGPQAHIWPPGTTERIWRFFATHPRP